MHRGFAIDHRSSNKIFSVENVLLHLFNLLIYVLEKMRNKLIQSEEFNMKENQCYNVSVLMNHHHQNVEKKLSGIVKSPIDG